MPDLALTRASRRPRSGPPRAPRVPRAPRLSRREGRGGRPDDLVVAVVTQHAESVLRITRRLSLCDADAEDAYQRAIEILLHNAGRLDPVRAPAWLRTVARHEALAIRAQRSAGLAREDQHPDEQVAVDLVSTEEQVDRVDRFTRAAEALRDLKPDEARALWLRAEGYSYDEIARRNAWTYTKVNRLLAEGRARFLARYAAIESGGACAEWQPVLSAIVDGEAEPTARRDAAVHLRSCLGCRATLRHLRSSAPSVRLALPGAGLLAVSASAAGRRPDGGVLRLLEGLWAGVHERAASAAVGAQTAVDGLSAGKVAAVTASVAALAGGGVVAVEQAAPPPLERAAEAEPRPATTPAAPSPEPAADPSAAAPGAGPAAVARASAGVASATVGATSGSRDRNASSGNEREAPEFAPPAEAAEPASASGAGEFGATGEFSGASSSDPSSSSSSAPSSSSSSGGGGSGGGEFSTPARQQDRGEFAP